MTLIRQLAIMSSLVGAPACRDTTSVCLLLPNPVVQADIRDSVTNAPMANQASLIVTGDGFYDSTFVDDPALAHSVVASRAPGRTGEYTVRVRREGYQEWQRADVHVEGSGCDGALSPLLNVRLQPLP